MTSLIVTSNPASAHEGRLLTELKFPLHSEWNPSAPMDSFVCRVWIGQKTKEHPIPAASARLVPGRYLFRGRLFRKAASMLPLVDTDWASLSSVLTKLQKAIDAQHALEVAIGALPE